MGLLEMGRALGSREGLHDGTEGEDEIGKCNETRRAAPERQ